MRKKVFLILLTMLLLVSHYSTGIFANGTQTFSDVNDSHWANKFVTKMNIRDVVNGYTDGTFQPNQQINQLEAVTMIVRFLGYQDDAENLKNIVVDENHDLYRYVHNTPEWAKGSVIVAVNIGLINIDSPAGFNPTEEATRAWIAKLLVTAIEKHGTLPDTNSSTLFVDSNSIPSWARSEIDAAAASQIITGYPDGTYKPDRAVSRAEMTALLFKSEQFISPTYLKNVVRGTIEVKQDNALIVNVGQNELKKLFMKSDALLYHNNSSITFDQLRTADSISVVVQNDTIVYLDLISASVRESSVVEGKVYLLDDVRKVLTIDTLDNGLLTYRFTESTDVYKNNTAVKISDINLNDEIKVYVEDNVATKVEITNVYENEKQAEIISINSSEKVVTVKYADGQFEVITINDHVVILDQENNRVSIDDLAVRQGILVQFEMDQIVSLKIPVSQLNGYVVTKVESWYITVSKDGKTQDYAFDSPLKLSIKGYADPKIEDVLVGDRIDAKLYQYKIVELNVTNRERKYYILDSKDLSAKAIRVKDEKTNGFSYITYDDNVKIYYNYNSLSSISQLSLNDRIVVSIQDGKVIRIDKANSSNYEIISIDEEQNIIRVKSSSNRVHTFKYSTDTIVKINNTTSFVANFSIGDRVNIYNVGNEIIEISK